MPDIVKPRDIIDRKHAVKELDAIAKDSSLKGPKKRMAVLNLMKELLAKGNTEIQRRFEESSDGEATVTAICHLTDQLVRLIYDFASEKVYPLGNPLPTETLALVAVGGYGRGDMAPQSDIDILFLYPYKQTGRHEQIVEYLLYMLWDLGLKVGHATRSVDDCIRMAMQDVTIRTNLLEKRYIWGDQKLFDLLEHKFAENVVSGTGRDFIDAKLKERDDRHQRMGDSRYVVEPNLKDGKGGLRDLHTLYWIGKYLYQVRTPDELVDRKVLTKREARGFHKAQQFFWATRCWLHYLAGRPEERLTFDMQRDIAERLGYTDHAGTSGVERFMKHYYLHAKHVGDLTRIFCAALEAQHQRRPLLRLPKLNLGRKTPAGYQLLNGRLAYADDVKLKEQPLKLLDLFLTAHEEGVDIHPASLRKVTQNLRLINNDLRDDPEANRIFMKMLCANEYPDLVLRQLNEAGVFGRFVPDFGRVVAQMQYDMYHTYTVDEHTIRAIGVLNAIERGELKDEAPLASMVIHKLLSREVLYVAVLLHDIAKGRGGDHSILGAEVARKLCPRLGLTSAETETVAWLVEGHLWMSMTAFKRDLTDPKTISDFAKTVQSPERLRLLLVLTVADIRAVGPNVWNAWKAALLRELYYGTADLLTGGHEADSHDRRVAAAQAAFKDALQNWDEATITAIQNRHYPSYWLSFDPATTARHAHLIREAERDKQPLVIDFKADQMRSATEVTIYTLDHPGLFSQIAGAMAVAGANIVDAKIQTMTDGMALDVFWVQDDNGEPFDQQSKLARLSAYINQIVAGEMRPLAELERQRQNRLPSRTEIFTVEPWVLIDNKASRTHTVIEVNATDRRALLHDITNELKQLSLQISSACIATYGEHAVDVFYVKDVFGMKVNSKAKFSQIRDQLEARLKAGHLAETGGDQAAE